LNLLRAREFQKNESAEQEKTCAKGNIKQEKTCAKGNIKQNRPMRRTSF